MLPSQLVGGFCNLLPWLCYLLAECVYDCRPFSIETSYPVCYAPLIIRLCFICLFKNVVLGFQLCLLPPTHPEETYMGLREA